MTSKPLAEALDEAFEQCRDMDASLNERFQALADAVRTLSPSLAEAVDSSTPRTTRSRKSTEYARAIDRWPP
jgi:hypothetical protein